MATKLESPRPGRWRLFALAAALVAVISVTFAAWLELRFGGDTLTTAVDDIGEAVAAGVAAVACAGAAMRAAARLRLAWGLLAASAASWCAGEIVWSVYEVGLGQSVPFPSAADAGFLAAIPLTVAGILSFSHTSRGTSVGVRLWLDRAIVFIALAFVGWELGLNSVFQQSAETPIDGAIALAYPLGDIAIGTVLLLAIRRATDEQQGRLLLLLAGLAAIAVADSAFAYLTAANSFGAVGSVLDTGWVAGYLVIALATLWPSGRRDMMAEEKPIDIWQLGLPWLAILAAGITALVQAARGHPLDTFGTVAAGVLAVLLMVSQVMAHNESLALLIRARLAAATLNEVIVNAPLGVVRIATDMSILQANPTFSSIMHSTVEDMTGVNMSSFLEPAEMERIGKRLAQISGGAAVGLDTQARRADGTTLWLHWTAAGVVNRAGTVDYYLVMFEDVSAHRAAEEVAAANLEVLQRLNKVKSQFLTKVSHEFRTALVGIQGISELLRDADTLDVAEVKALANDMFTDAQRLDRSLNEMLELDRVEAGRVALQLSSFDLRALIMEAVSTVQRGVPEHAIETDLGAVPQVAGDSDLLAQVLVSLLHRAIEYSPLGASIQVSARTLTKDVQVSIADSGRASSSDLEAQLLGRAEPISSHAQVLALASQVGIPMARQIIEMHGGRLWFENGAGTTWNFTVPIAVAAPRSTAQTSR